MRIQYLLVLALVPSLFAQNTGQSVKQTENQVNNTNKSDIVSNVQNVPNPVLQNTNQQSVQPTSNNEKISQQSNNAQSSVQQNSTVNNNQNNVQQTPADTNSNVQDINQNNTQQNIPEANLKNIKERCEPIINLVLGKIPEKSVPINTIYTIFPKTVYKILKENNITDYNAIEPLWTEIISKYKPEIDNLNKQLEEYVDKENNGKQTDDYEKLMKYNLCNIQSILTYYVNYIYFNEDKLSVKSDINHIINDNHKFDNAYMEFVSYFTGLIDDMNMKSGKISESDLKILSNLVFQKIQKRIEVLKNMEYYTESRSTSILNIDYYAFPIILEYFNDSSKLYQLIQYFNGNGTYYNDIYNDVITKAINQNGKNTEKISDISYITYYIEHNNSWAKNFITTYVMENINDINTESSTNTKDFEFIKKLKKEAYNNLGIIIETIEKSPNKDDYKYVLDLCEQPTKKNITIEQIKQNYKENKI